MLNRLATRTNPLGLTMGRTHDSRVTFALDERNHLASATTDGTIGPQPEITLTYTYYALDRRTAKTVDGVTEAYFYDSADLCDSTSDNPALTFRAGELVKRWHFVPQVHEPLAYVEYSGTTEAGSGSVIKLLANRLGSIITAVLVSTGAIAAEYDYQAYGARVEIAALEQPYGFTGREHDAENGLIHLRARAHDPETGTFLQVDPMEFQAGTPNLFSDVSNDPLDFTDPLGPEAVACDKADGPSRVKAEMPRDARAVHVRRKRQAGLGQ